MIGMTPRRTPWRDYLRHLRLPFNLLLSPIYLWGVWLAGGSPDRPAIWLGYLALHGFLYGGTTAFNSYYDRDTGPVGGMLEPPPTDRGLLGFSLAWQALGLLLALPVGWPFAATYLALFAVAAAYSHPRVRLKAHPALALLAVGVGQGAIGFAAGWLAAQPDPTGLLSPAALWGMLATAGVVAGLYIITQSYQTAEDRARGDRTLPVLWGPRRALYAALGLLGAGGSLLLLRFGGLLGPVRVTALLALFALLGFSLLRWAARFDEADVRGNFRVAMRLAALGSTGLGAIMLSGLLSR
jgi:4-hydroxybenzoate polyprenyltransferase